MAKESDITPPSPRENPLLFGHEAAERQFLEEFNRGTAHHAYLMTGSKGIGKATLAYRFARFVLSARDQAAAPPSLFGDALPAAPRTDLSMSPEEPLFRRVVAGSHSDLLVLSPAFDAKKGVEKAEISAADARKVPEFLSLTPAEGDWRVVVVDSVDQLNIHAANALLKIVEEPPLKAMLFLICHEPGGILATIRSRCRHFRLNAPDKENFERVLEVVAPSLERADWPALYALSYGSPGYAITLATHDALRLYDTWLSAMRPGATHAEEAALIDLAGRIKEPEAWAVFVHCWRTALHRISIYPNVPFAVSSREGEKLSAIAAAIPPALRQRWAGKGGSLLNLTDTFNLDKRTTARLMLDPARLDRLAA